MCGGGGLEKAVYKVSPNGEGFCNSARRVSPRGISMGVKDDPLLECDFFDGDSTPRCCELLGIIFSDCELETGAEVTSAIRETNVPLTSKGDPTDDN